MAAPKELRILVPVDFSDSAKGALVRGLELARRLEGKVRLLHVVDTSGLLVTGVESYVNVASLAAQLRAKAKADLETLADATDPGRKLIASVEVYDGGPANAIVECAKEDQADMIVMGTHGRTGLPRLFLGSVAERVVRLAPCDVLVVHGPKGGGGGE